VKPVRLRAHHFLCILTYVGRGYSRAFVKRYNALAADIARGRAVELVSGPDDICAGFLGRHRHCGARSIRNRDAAAMRDLTRLGLLPRGPFRLPPARLKRMRALFAAGLTRRACAGCEWKRLCDRVAASGFDGRRLP
jgi:hypothetical protein